MYPVMSFLMFIVGAMAGTIAHEGGHLIFAVALGLHPRRVMAPEAPLPPISPMTPEIFYHLGRGDLFMDDWARRDASSVMRHILDCGNVTSAERALVLEFLVGNEILNGETGASDNELDAWSLQFLQLFESPSARVTRGMMLDVLGRATEAQAMLTLAIGQTLDPINATLCRLALSRVRRALGNDVVSAGVEQQAAPPVPDSPNPRISHMMARLDELLD